MATGTASATGVDYARKSNRASTSESLRHSWALGGCSSKSLTMQDWRASSKGTSQDFRTSLSHDFSCFAKAKAPPGGHGGDEGAGAARNDDLGKGGGTDTDDNNESKVDSQASENKVDSQASTDNKVPSGRGSTVSSTFSKAEEFKRLKSLTHGMRMHMTFNKGRSASMSSLGLKARDRDLRDPWSCVTSCLSGCRRYFHGWVEVVTTTAIVLDVLFCGAEVEYTAHSRVLESPREMWWISFCFSLFFTLELLARAFAEGREFFRMVPHSGWNIFDVCVIGVSWVDITWDGGGATQSIPTVRIIRMARIIRVLRVARIMRHFRSLRILLYSVMNTIRSLVWTLMLLAVILYVFGLLFTQAATQHLLSGREAIPMLEDCYGSVGRSVYSLFKAISNGVSWGEIVEPLSALHPVWVSFYLIYFAFTYFAVLNVVTGVFCQTAIESASHDQEVAAQAQMAAEQQHTRRLHGLFKTINRNQTGMITLQELEKCMRDEKLRAYFASLDLTTDEAFSLFKLLDTANAHVLDTNTFVTGCLKLRGPAKSLDIAKMVYESRWSMNKVYQRIKMIEDRLMFVTPMNSDVCMLPGGEEFQGMDPTICGFDPKGSIPLCEIASSGGLQVHEF